MRKIYSFLILIIGVFCINFNVYAQDYQPKELIQASAVATVETDLFTYKDFTVKKFSVDKGIINFASIVNKNDKKLPVSVNILLFDEKKLNIGYVTYCTDKDYSSDYTNFELVSKGATSFSINIASKYLLENSTVNDIEYIAVMDENKYCHVGGYDKYKGLTIEQIATGKVAANYSTEGTKLNLLFFLRDKGMLILIVVIVGVISLFIINGLILNALYKRMYASTTPMSYIPILCNYVAVKLSFGPLISKIYLVALLLSIPLYLIGGNVLLIIANVLAVIASFVVIIKLITKRYDLFYYEPAVKNVVKGNDGGLSVNVGNNNTDFITGDFAKADEPSTLNEEVIDLSYDNVSSDNNISDSVLGSFNNNNNSSNSASTDNNISVGISAGGLSNSNEEAFGEMLEKNEEVKEQSNNDAGESDLSKFFK